MRYSNYIDDYVEELNYFLKMVYKITNSLIPTIIGGIGMGYTSIPSEIQQNIYRYVLPYTLRKIMLESHPVTYWITALFIVSLTMTLFGAFGSKFTTALIDKKHKEIKSDLEILKNEMNVLEDNISNQKIDCYRFFSDYIYQYAISFRMGVDERVSLYKKDMEVFSCIGRFSENETYKLKSNRVYPKQQGVIGECYNRGQIEDMDSPDPILYPSEWVSYHHQKFGLAESDLEQIGMKSRAYLAYRLKNAQNSTVAVLVFESLEPGGLKLAKIKKYFTDNCGELAGLANMIESLEKHYLPTLEDARNSGL